MSHHIIGPDTEAIGWDPEHPDTAKAAKARWRRLRARGYELYAPDGTPLEDIDESLGRAYADPTIPPPHIVAAWPKR